ncbi:MAG: zinc-binding dehydrogenase [Saprospiraceae bacterium]|nr:zinc-binding dehydrogenase [Saprospiraceae bacterium]
MYVTKYISSPNNRFLWQKKVLFPIPTINKADVNFLKNLVETEQFKPVIDRVYSLDQIVEAYKYVETGQKIGNVVIKVIA